MSKVKFKDVKIGATFRGKYGTWQKTSSTDAVADDGYEYSWANSMDEQVLLIEHESEEE